MLPLAAFGVSAVVPLFFYDSGGCITMLISPLELLHGAGGWPLVLAALPIHLCAIVLAVLIAVAGVKRLARGRHSRRQGSGGPLPSRGSRRVAVGALLIVLSSSPVVAGLLLSLEPTDTPLQRGPLLRESLLALLVVAALIGAALLRRAARARGWPRWGLLLATFTCLAAPCWALLSVLAFPWWDMSWRGVPGPLAFRPHYVAVLCGLPLLVISVAALVALSIVAAWPARRIERT